MVGNFIPLALDTYFRGTSEDVEYCKKLKAGGNHLTAGTAGGRPLGSGKRLRLRERDLAAVLEEFRALPEEERKPKLPPVEAASPPKRPVPAPPEGGLILRGYCTYLKRDAAGGVVRSQEWYYKENPDRWAAETQSDLLWVTKAERDSLVPADPKAGDRHDVRPALRKRFFSTLGIDYMEGSVNALPCRESRLELTVERVTAERIEMRLEGAGKMGKEPAESARQEPHSRGCELRVIGFVGYDRERKAFDRFDVVGVGRAWGNKMDYVRREVRLSDYPWTYGIACELVTARAPADLIPPYNMLHYGGGLKYFGE